MADDWDNYIEFKEGYGGDHGLEIYEGEARRAGLQSGKRVLEIGFGGGAFLDHCKAEGCDTWGTEIILELVNRVQENGHQVFHTSQIDTLPLQEESVDLVFAFHVFEHLTKDELVKMLKAIHRVLKRDGRLVASFPNGASPMAGAYQYGDMTHKIFLTAERMKQLGLESGFVLDESFNAVRPINAGRKPKWVKKMVFALRDLLQNSLSMIYFGRIIPLDPVVTVHLTKT